MYKKIRFYFWLLIGIFRRYFRIIVVTFVTGIFLLIFIVKFAPIIFQNNQAHHQIIGIVGSFTPTTLPLNIQRLISLGLTEIDESGEAQPSIAKSWKISADCDDEGYGPK